mmetsp:Transcript_13968/g.20597  ORF Transcript_13968/g.20597 Transcript_13968/m.20597 type:complete len:208 (-) Transcript_13968:129-752(-)
MGSCSSKTLEESRPSNTNLLEPKTWSLSQVQQLHQRYRDENYDFGLDRLSFGELIADTFPDEGEDNTGSGLADFLWGKFVVNNEEVVHTLQVFCGLMVASHGMSLEKLDFLFDMFDFNTVGELNYDEVFILLYTVLSGAVRVMGEGQPPEERAVEKVVDDLFMAANKDVASKITRAEYIDFSQNLLKITEEDVQPQQLLVKFDLIDT